MNLFICKKIRFPIYALLFLSISLFACKKDSNENIAQNYSTTGNASGSQENPPNSSSGSGTLTGTYNSATNVWQYNINWNSLTSAATAVELRGPASIGVNGALMFALSISAPGINGTASGNVTLSAQQEADLLANKCYYTIRSSTYLTGEIRGNITAIAN